MRSLAELPSTTTCRRPSREISRIASGVPSVVGRTGAVPCASLSRKSAYMVVWSRCSCTPEIHTT